MEFGEFPVVVDIGLQNAVDGALPGDNAEINRHKLLSYYQK